MSGSTGGVGGSGNGGTNVHSNDTHDTHGASAAGGQTQGAQTAQANGPASVGASTPAQPAQANEGDVAHPDAHRNSEAVNAAGPTPSQVGALNAANVESPAAQLQRAMSAPSPGTITQTPAALQAPTVAAANAPAELGTTEVGADGLPKANPSTTVGDVGTTVTQAVDPNKPSVTLTLKNAGVIKASDAFNASVVLHSAPADERPGAPRVDATISYSSTVASTTAAQSAAAKAAAEKQAQDAPGVQLNVGAVNIGTPSMTVNADAMIKGVGWTLKGTVGYNIKSNAVSFGADGTLALSPNLNAIAHFDQTPPGRANVSAGMQYNITKDMFVKGEYRNFGGVSSGYVGVGIKFSF